ncbi:hypothetical protein DFH11DRAFT_1797273 [Phellopilus nigrolimitatus]|nr:hypothetical protein DFH11DRAFT_1797273 [Phellopilus nigrolimitatus]
MIEDVPELIERKFPDDVITHWIERRTRNTVKLPEDIISDIMKLDCMRSFIKPEGTPDSELNPWHLNYPMNTEKSPKELVAAHFNALADSIYRHYDISEKLRYVNVFSCELADSPKNVWTTNRKPDIIVSRVSAHEKQNRPAQLFWDDAFSAWILKTLDTPATRREAHDQLSCFAFRMFNIQPATRFFLGVALLGTTLLFYTFDRSGDLVSDAFDIRENPEKLCRVVVALSNVDGRDIGWDVLFNGCGDVQNVYVNDTLYENIKLIHRDPYRVGKGVRCYSTEKDGIQYVIKDTWIDCSSKSQEYKLLEKIKGVEGVVQIVDYELIPGKNFKVDKDTTATDRLPLLEDGELPFACVLRDHYRIAMKPYGQCLLDFDSLPELLTAIKDIIRAIQALHKRNILHRDVSLANIVLVSIAGQALRRGVLIDFDSAIDFSEDYEGLEDATGTVRFMARGILELLGLGWLNTERHAYYHDLESLFYVLCWICTAQAGPHDTERADFDKTRMARQWDEIEERTLEYKKRTMESSIDFGFSVMSQFSAYFDPIRSCVRELRNVLFVKEEQLESEEADTQQRVPPSRRDRDELCDELCEIIDKALHDLAPPECSLNSEKDPEDGSKMANTTTVTENGIQTDNDSARSASSPDRSAEATQATDETSYAGSKRERSVEVLNEPESKRTKRP